MKSFCSDTEQLRTEHFEILDLLTKIKNRGISNSENSLLFNKVKVELFNHLKKEDEILYPVLYEESKNDSNLKDLLQIFATDFEDLKQRTLQFFNKFPSISSSPDFSKEFGHLIGLIQTRIGREESLIFCEYERVIQQKKNAA